MDSIPLLEAVMPGSANFFDITPRNWRSRLAISADFMRELSRYTDPEELYEVFARRMSQLFPTSRQVTVSRRGLQAPRYRVTRFNLWKEQVNPYREPHRLPLYSGGLMGQLIYADFPQIIDDLVLDPDDPSCDFFEGQRSLLSIPIYENGVSHSMVVVSREEPHAFPKEQVPELVWMSNMFGRAMQTLAVTEQLQRTNATAEYELKVIADLQHSLLPATTPRVPGLEVAVHYQTANRAGGDYYDFFPLPDNRLGVLVADVSGHGTPAAVLLAITHSLAHSYNQPPEKPGEFLAYINQHLTRRYTGQTGHFVTAFYVVFDPRAGTMTYANAGHPPCLRGQLKTGWDTLPNSQGLPLGVAPRSAPYPDQVAKFAGNDRVVLLTDGILEATNRNGEYFGRVCFEQALRRGEGSAQQVMMDVLDHLQQFTYDQPLRDDRTLLVVRHSEVAGKVLETPLLRE